MNKSRISDTKLEKKRYRKRYQRYLQLQEYDFLDTKFNSKKTHKKKIKKSHSNKKVEKILKEKTTVEIDLSTFLLMLKQLLLSNKITKDQIIQIIAEAEEKKDSIIIKSKFSDKEYKLTKQSDKNECRAYWLYLMEKGELFCDICGNPITTIKGPQRLTYDHIIPQSKGGKTNGENASATHQVCNGLKTDYLPSEWEQIGLTVLAAHKIPVDLLHCLYEYKLVNNR